MYRKAVLQELISSLIPDIDIRTCIRRPDHGEVGDRDATDVGVPGDVHQPLHLGSQDNHEAQTFIVTLRVE